MPPNVRDCVIKEGEPEEIRQGQCQFLHNCTKEMAGDVVWLCCLAWVQLLQEFLDAISGADDD